jgi:hypothetical protein
MNEFWIMSFIYDVALHGVYLWIALTDIYSSHANQVDNEVHMSNSNMETSHSLALQIQICWIKVEQFGIKDTDNNWSSVFFSRIFHM